MKNTIVKGIELQKFFNFRRKWSERLTFCSKFYENRWIGFVDKALFIFFQCLTMEAAIFFYLVT